MAKQNHKPERTNNKTPTTRRFYTVGYVPKNGDTDTPAINLKGKWLRDSGFETGLPLIVTIEQGRIVIEPELMV